MTPTTVSKPIYYYELTVYSKSKLTEPPFPMQFVSDYPSMCAGAEGEFYRKHPDLNIMKGFTQAGKILF